MKKTSLLGLPALLLVTSAAPAQQPKFDLADVHASTTPRWFVGNYEQDNTGHIRDGRYVYRDARMLNLIEEAYGVSKDLVSGGPDWLGFDLFDVIAKVPDGTTPATARLMLRSLLAERFALVARHETQPMPRFVLSVSKAGSKLKPAAESQDSGCKEQTFGMEGGRGGPMSIASLPNQKFSCHNLTSTQIVENLRMMAGSNINNYITREIVDSTGLQGKWDFDLEFTPISIVGDKGRDGITLYDALSKQAGLTLELKDVPVPALVVESVNRNPTPNSPAVKTDLAVATARFEVASIKPINPAEPMRFGPLGGSELRFLGTLRNLITQAFMLTPNSANDVIIDLPKSGDSQVWLITAKLPSTGEGAPTGGGARPQPPPRSLVMEMLRGVLADQFELKTHTEDREVTVYAMTPMGGKPKMTPGDPKVRSDCQVDPTAVKPFPNMGTMMNCTNITVAEYAEGLNQATGFFDHPLVDASGLKGGWNFKIGWSRANQGRPLAQGGAAGDAPEPTGLSSYEAVEYFMGLKLVKQKRPYPVIVVDHVDEMPLQ
jgi:uncharacterized protein (TIGR03435 family)